jgi:hypothetical protein
VTNQVSICDGDSYTEGSSVYTTTGIYQDTYVSSIGCDSIVTTELTVNPIINVSNEVSICEGQSYTEGSSVYTSTGSYTDVYQTGLGCDSIVTTELTVNPIVNVSNEVSICDGESYTEGTSIYTTTGIYTDTYQTSLGCDSVVTTDLTVNPGITVSNQVSICDGETYVEGSSVYTMTGIYADSYITSSGCDSVVTTDLTVTPGYITSNDVSICAGGSYTEGTSVYTVAGSYVDSYQTVAGCDSVITTVLTVTDQFEVTNQVSICDGDSYTEGSSVYTTTGIYQDTYVSSIGCDSIVTTELTVNPIINVSNEVSICEGQSYTEGSSVYTTTGVYQDTYVSSIGCDSVVTTDLTVGLTASITNQVSICEGQSYTEGSSVYNATGIYTDSYQTTLGCDSIVTTDLTVGITASITNQVSICEGESYTEGSSVYTATGIYAEVYQTGLGCDSIVMTELTVDPTINVSNEVTICEGESYTEGNSTYTVSGVYTDAYVTAAGCDSTVTTVITVIQNPGSYIEVEICEGETYIEGSSAYTISGTYVDIYIGAQGCDSVVTTELAVVDCCEPYTSFVEDRICESLPSDSIQIFVLEGVFDWTYAAVDGCDSIVTTQVILDPSYFLVESIDICEGSSYAIGDEVYSESGEYNFFYETIQGCDSVISINLDIHSANEFSNNINLCEDEILIVGNSIYSESGVYVDSLQSLIGCDSIVTTYVSVLDNPVTSIDTVLCEGDSLLLGGNTYIETGIYTDIYASYIGCDSVVITNLFIAQAYEDYKEARICEGEYHIEGPSSYNEAGVYYDLYLTEYGCDSVVITELEVLDCNCSVFVPNAVTADGDELNDVFQIAYECEFWDYELAIYNRWGEQIFFSTNPDEKWTPSLIGSNFYAPDGIYSWTLRYSYIDNLSGLPIGPIRKTGSVTVLR